MTPPSLPLNHVPAEKHNSSDRYLLVAITGEPGKWDAEKATVKKACDEVLESMDLDEVSVAVWRRDVVDHPSLIKLACKELSPSCKGATRVPISPGRTRADLKHEPTDGKIVETEQMMQNMEEAGSPMVMQSREDIEDEMREMAEDMGMSKEELEMMMKHDPALKGGNGMGGDL